MAWILFSWIFVLLFIFSLFICFHQLKDKLDQIKEKIDFFLDNSSEK